MTFETSLRQLTKLFNDFSIFPQFYSCNLYKSIKPVVEDVFKEIKGYWLNLCVYLKVTSAAKLFFVIKQRLMCN